MHYALCIALCIELRICAKVPQKTMGAMGAK